MPPGKQSSEISYILYGVEKPPSGQKLGAEQSLQATSDMEASLRHAEEVFSSGKYLSLEVKKKYTEDKTGRVIEISLKRFDLKAKKDFGIVLFLILAVVAGAAAFGVTLLLARLMGA